MSYATDLIERLGRALRLTKPAPSASQAAGSVPPADPLAAISDPPVADAAVPPISAE